VSVWHDVSVIAELVATAIALSSYPPPGTQGLRQGSDPRHGALQLPSELRRPLQLPRPAPRAPCPISESHELSSDFAPGLGQGPVYPLQGPTLRYIRGGRFPRQFPRPWGGQKVLWVTSPDYAGPILIRGHQLSGRWWLGFDGAGGRPYAEMRLLKPTANPGHVWRQFPSYTRVRARGCYAYQIDGTNFSTVVVFRAAP
jgi:hypothetical protein